MSIQEKFERFKRITKEEEIISSLVKERISIKDKTSVLDIGSNKGKISFAIQSKKENVTLVDVEEFKIKKANFLKGRWEEINIQSKYDLIIASHVWGHFNYTQTLDKAFEKAISSLKNNGKLVLCYNTNDGFMEKLIKYSESIFETYQYDYFDENLLKSFNSKEILFNVILEEKNFSKLTDLIQVLIITDDREFILKKKKLEKFLESNLSKPSFEINQKIIIITK